MESTLPRLVLGLPHLASEPGTESVLIGRKGPLAELVKMSRIFRLTGSGPSLSPEASWLGLDPEQWSIPQGPLTLSWLKLTPPDDSLSFHVSLGGLDGDKLVSAPLPTEEEEKEIVAALRRLDGPKLSLCPGEGLDHGLVWTKASPELATMPWLEAQGKEWQKSLPKGERERPLEQWIEDALELLSATESTKRREDEGVVAVKSAWPWGQGRLPSALNLPLRRGFVTRHLTSSIRVSGLARLFGERVLPGPERGRSLGVDFSRVLNQISLSEPLVTVFSGLTEMRTHNRLDAMEKFLDQFESQFLTPLFDAYPEGLRLTLLGSVDPLGQKPGLNWQGIGLNFDSRRVTEGRLPFDERIVEDSAGQSYPLHEAVSRGLMGGSTQN